MQGSHVYCSSRGSLVHINQVVKYHMLVSNDGVSDVACFYHECIRTSVFMHYHLIHILALLQKCSIEKAGKPLQKFLVTFYLQRPLEMEF